MSGRSGSASSATRATGKVAPAASTEGPSLHSEADLQAHLEVGDAAVGDLAADLLGLEPLDVAHRLGGLADRVPDGVVDAGLAAAHDLAQPVHVVGHGAPPRPPPASVAAVGPEPGTDDAGQEREPTRGLEPRTARLQVECATSCATPAGH